jgi:hypothetical protein
MAEMSLLRPLLRVLGVLWIWQAGMAWGAAPNGTLTEKGWVIDAGAMGKFTLPVPGLKIGEKDYKGEKPVVELVGGVLKAKYPSGAELEMKASGAHAVTYSFSAIPEEARGFCIMMELPIRLSTGGRFALGKKEPVAFPEVKEAQLVGQGWADSLKLWDASGSGFRLVVPGDYQQMQDNRVFGWPVFMYIYNFNFSTQQGKTSFVIKVEDIPASGAAPAAAVTTPATLAAPGSFLVDRYGQSAKKEFPGKVKSDDELKADGVKQLAEMAAFKSNPALDIYGGLAGSGEKYKLKKTGFFHTSKVEGRHVLVTPEGNVFFQLAVCGITNTDDYTTLRGREKIYEWIPPQDELFGSAWRPNTPGAASFYIANWIRKFGKPYNKEEWVAQAVTRLRSWGFNSSGAFSGNPETFAKMNFANVGFLPLGEGEGIKLLPDKIGAASLLDPFVPGTEAALDKKFAEKIAPKAGDPLMIGYYLGNEQHFELLPKLVPSYKASKVAAKARLVGMLQAKYKDIASFNKAWNPAKPFADFEALKEEPLFIRTDAGNADMKEFYELYLEAYFSMVERVFRKHDPNHLIIGNRMTPGTANNEPAVRISSKYTDVASINYYSYAIEESFLKKFNQWSGDKPLIFSEWYYATTDHGLNGGKEVKDQAERAKGYRNYIEQAAALPFVVGSQWFIYMDQAITGRFFEGFNGEGANTGFVDVADRPYTELVEAAKLTHSRVYNVMLGKEKPYAYEDPRFIGKSGGGGSRVVVVPKALPGLKMDGTTTNWPGRPAEPIESSRLVLGNANPDLRGDFRLCWDAQNLYFLIQVKDPTPLKSNKSGDKLWGADGVELFIGAKDLQQSGNMIFSDRQILIGAKEKPEVFIVDHAEDAKLCQVLVVKDVTGDGYVLQTAIPWKVLGVEPGNGLEMLFDVAVDNSDDGDFRKQQLAWNGTSKNSNDRAAWGRAKIVDN